VSPPAKRRPGNGEEPPESGPEITSIVPGTAVPVPGAQATLHGSGFGRRVTASRVSFKLNAPDLPPVAAEIVSWADDAILVRVPPLSALGAAGRASVTLSTPSGSSSILFVVRDVQPPVIRSLAPALALPGAELRITGDRLGVAATPGQGISFAGQLVPVASWTRAEVRVTVPDPASIGGAGPQPVRAHTPWGVSAPVMFTIAEPPAVTSVSPAEGPPDSVVTISGHAFGEFRAGVSTVELRFREPDTRQLVVTPMEMASWTPSQIRAFVPGLAALRASGDKELVVRTPVAQSVPVAFGVRDVASITTWTRIEPHARTDDLDLGLRLRLRAELADPLWLLGTQWVLGELRGEDAGSPVVVQVDGEAAALCRWRPGREGTAADLPAGVPLETVVEREPVFPVAGSTQPFADRRLAAEAGLHFLRLLDLHVRPPAQAQLYRQRYLHWYAMAAASAVERAAFDPATLRFLAVMAGRAPDGGRLFADLRQALAPERGGTGRLPADPQIGAGDVPAVLAAVADWFTWCEALVSVPAAGVTAWEADRLEYAFAVAATTSAGEVVLEAPEYSQGRLDWHAFQRGDGSLGAGTSGLPGPIPITRTVVPAPVGYPGMPAARWWELEDAAVDFGLIDAGPTDLARLLLVEFATVSGDDWYTIPVGDVPLGSVVRITALRITDTFGDHITASPFRENQSGGAFRLFQPTDRREDRRDLLVLPACVLASLESAPLEDVAFIRDELANMGWAVERTVASATGRPLARQQANSEPQAAEPPDGAPQSQAQLSYKLMTPVPEFWIPLVPTPDGGSRRLTLAALRRLLPDGSLEPIRPSGRILQPATHPPHFFDSEIPPVGVRVTRTWQLARDSAGFTHLWVGRQKRTAVREPSPGLRFDAATDV
jgi:hypothetical protein